MQPHPAATTATNSNPLQQRIAPPRHPLAVCIIAIEIVREPLLVRHELLPIDISRKCVLQTNWPILYRHRFRRANQRGDRLACAGVGHKHKPLRKPGSLKPEGCARCSPVARRCHAAMARRAVAPATAGWLPENGASPPWRCEARETWRINAAGAPAPPHRD